MCAIAAEAKPSSAFEAALHCFVASPLAMTGEIPGANSWT